MQSGAQFKLSTRMMLPSCTVEADIRAETVAEHEEKDARLEKATKKQTPKPLSKLGVHSRCKSN